MTPERIEPIHGFTVWTPGERGEYRASVSAMDGVVSIATQVDDDGQALSIPEQAAVALYYALGSWMQRRGKSENGPLPVVTLTPEDIR